MTKEKCKNCGKPKCDHGREWCTSQGTEDGDKFCHGNCTTDTIEENLTIQGLSFNVRHFGQKKTVVNVQDIESLLHQQRQQLIGEILEGISKFRFNDCGHASPKTCRCVTKESLIEAVKSKLTE